MAQQKKLSWFALIKWTFLDRNDKTYSTEGKSRFYDRIAKDFFHRDRLANYITETTLSLFPNSKPAICERAAGSGIITESLYKSGLENIRSSDLSESQLLILKEKLPNIQIAVEDFNTPMKTVNKNTFDILFQVGATRFMTKKGQINYVKEAARTLQKNGFIFWPVIWSEIPLAWWRVGWNSPRTTTIRIKRLLEKNGFEIIKAPVLIHGRMGLLTSTFIIAKNNKTITSKNIFKSYFHLLTLFKIKFLKHE